MNILLVSHVLADEHILSWKYEVHVHCVCCAVIMFCLLNTATVTSRHPLLQVVSFYEERESEARKKERSAISEDELLEITANTPATDFESMETKLDAVFAVQEKMKSGE